MQLSVEALEEEQEIEKSIVDNSVECSVSSGSGSHLQSYTSFTTNISSSPSTYHTSSSANNSFTPCSSPPTPSPLSHYSTLFNSSVVNPSLLHKNSNNDSIVDPNT